MRASLRWNVENAPVEDFFKWARNRSIRYFVNPGNAGDCLIALATYRMFEAYNISWKPASTTNLAGEIVVIAGGGNLVPYYNNCAEIAKAAFKQAKMTVILPHTIKGQHELFKEAGDNVIVFCRDSPSYAEFLTYDTRARGYLTHDMAFFLDVEALLHDDAISAAAQPRLQELLLKHKIDLAADVLNKDVSCLRSDAEKTSLQPVGRNLDISAAFKTGTQPKQSEAGAWMMLEFIRLCGTVTTNRLHVGVGACLVQAKANLHDNSYGKVSSIYLHSIRGRFDTINYIPPPS